ncbi:hypothetical protein [Ferruginivarius sediminum]|uniref:hypothetical protein n=1 Tax=Ferruginivarius sediminum TaxID=2661937 RepID=UPI001293DF4C|nr:hypothetical protein [Ferruginivarius sediminum]
MTIADIAAYPLKRRSRATQWLTEAVKWVKAELHAAQVQSQDEQFLATAKGIHYRRL